jgi:hypothetical protein
MYGRRARYSGGVPAAVQSGNILLAIRAFGHNGTNYSTNSAAQIQFRADENFTTTAQGSRMGFFTTAIGATASTERLRIDAAGNVGIANTAPRATLDVTGTIATKAATANTVGPIDYSVGNIQYTTNSCATYSLYNLKDGASYIFIVKGGTAATCVLNTFSDSGTTGLTEHYPPDHGDTTVSKHTMYNLLVVGTDVYISWTPGL